MASYTKSDRGLGRRVFLKALGIGVAAPLAFRMSRLALAGPSPAPVRLFIYYIPNGVPVEHFEPFGSGASFLAGSSILAPLAPFGSYVNIVRGVSMNDGAENHAAIAAVLTGFKDGGTVNSIDHTIAQTLGVEPYTLGAIPYNKQESQAFDSRSFLIKHGSWVVATTNPAEAATDLLGSIGKGQQGMPQQADESEFRNAALGLTESQLDRMSGSLKGLTSEQNKLSVHLDSVRALKASIDRPVVSGCSTAPMLPAVAALQGKDVMAHENLGLVVDAHLEVAAAAMICGTARVITMQNLWTPAEVRWDFAGGPGIPKNLHDPLSHSRDVAGRTEFAQAQRFFYDRLAKKLLPALSQPDPLDPGRTVLDNTLIYICSELADGADHNSVVKDVYVDGGPFHSYLPTVLIGKAGGYLAQKGVVDVNVTHTDVLATLAEAMGAPVTTIGGQAVRPVPELKS